MDLILYVLSEARLNLLEKEPTSFNVKTTKWRKTVGKLVLFVIYQFQDSWIFYILYSYNIR